LLISDPVPVASDLITSPAVPALFERLLLTVREPRLEIINFPPGSTVRY